MSYQSFTKTSFAAVSTVMALQSQGLVQANMQDNNWSIESAKEIAQDLFPSQERSSVEKVAKDKYSSSSCKQSWPVCQQKMDQQKTKGFACKECNYKMTNDMR